jgi:hypothetical protein
MTKDEFAAIVGPLAVDVSVLLREGLPMEAMHAEAAVVSLRQLQAENEALRKDALRYRHMRNATPRTDRISAHCRVYDGYHFFMGGEALDNALDREME